MIAPASLHELPNALRLTVSHRTERSTFFAIGVKPELEQTPNMALLSLKKIGIGRSIVWSESAAPELQGAGEEINGEQVIVAFYRPAGNNNRIGQFALNVQKPEESILQENEEPE
ncbi:unnamed protein product [Gongylonema pulchrum]|uniref:ANAPC4_WD40 domain-containing protein n=1 Tax=Gongylonema pulchrum TaxID=637853 RepID=A0A183E5K4_9BILA|nr:unnamed protein product [Gongylonema pulchrum]